MLTCKLPLLTETKQNEQFGWAHQRKLTCDREMAAEIGIGHHVVHKGRAQTSVQNVSSLLLEQYAVKGNDSLQHADEW